MKGLGITCSHQSNLPQDNFVLSSEEKYPIVILLSVTALLPETFDLNDLAPALLERFAASLSRLATQAAQRIGETKRVALLLCWLWRLRTELIDTALTMGNALIAGVFRRAKNAATEEQQRQFKQLGSVLQLCGDVVGVFA
jgi:hypothetical protein